MQEIWKNVKGYEGMYQVSNLGNVKSLTRKVGRRNNTTRIEEGKAMSLRATPKGYKRVELRNEGRKVFMVHRLVFEAFIDFIKLGNQINHINGIKHDNRIENLEQCTQSENIKHSIKYLNRKSTVKKGSKLYFCTKAKKVICIETGEEFKSIRDASKKLGIWTIHSQLKGRQKTAGGLTFRYKI